MNKFSQKTLLVLFSMSMGGSALHSAPSKERSAENKSSTDVPTKKSENSLIAKPLVETLKDLQMLVVDGEHLVGGERIVAELKVKPTESVCWYEDGAVVNVAIRNRDVYDGIDFVIRGLSESVDETSIILTPPKFAIVTGFLRRDDKRSLRLDVKKLGDLKCDDLWHIQYVTRNVHWVGLYQLKLSDDKQFVTFVFLIRISNRSGINFKNPQVIFFETKLPDTTSEQREYIPCLVHKHDINGDIISGQDRTIIVSSAKRIRINTHNGLFVGGEYLKKMGQPAHPRIENWVTFPNTVELSLGQPLPSGQVQVFYSRGDFTSLVGFSKMHSVEVGGDVTIRLPSLVQNGDTAAQHDEYAHLDVQLTQENYRILAPNLSEAEYRLVLTNPKDSPVTLSVTVDANQFVSYSVSRSSMNYEKNKKGEASWLIEIPPRGAREVRYKLTIRTVNAVSL
jgi:hypothetical protein